MSTIVVTPSIRNFPLEYFESVKNAKILIVDDTGGTLDRSATLAKAKEQGFNMTVYNREMIEAYMPNGKAHLIPQRNPSCKNFGLYYAWKEGFDTIVLLDDDCDTRITPDYLERIPVGKTITLPEDDSDWFNTLSLISDPERTLFARGYPYEYRNFYRRIYPSDLPEITVTPKLNEGMWAGEPDINGVDKLEMLVRLQLEDDQRPWEITDRCAPPNVVLGRRTRLPLSIMNVQLVRELVPAFYQPPDFEGYNTFKIRRHDDVYAMLVLNAIMAIKGDRASAGEPMIYHTKPGLYKKEILSEHMTHIFQQHLMNECEVFYNHNWRNHDAGYTNLAILFGIMLVEHSFHYNGRFSGYLRAYGKGIRDWAELFK